MSTASLYCGEPPMAFGLWPRRHSAGGVPSLFSGRQISYSFNTRVAIRKAADILGLKPGDEILAPAYNCGSELDPLRHFGLDIRLYPITPSTGIDPDQLERMIGPRTRAVYLTHYFGFLQRETAAIRRLCDAHGLLMIEDCALSLLSGEAPAEGSTGDVSVFCFYKFFPVLAGGALVVNNNRFAATVEFSRPAPTKVVGKRLLRAGLSSLLGPAGAARLTRQFRARKDLGKLPVGEVGVHPDMPTHYYFDPSLQDAQISGLTSRALSGFDVASAIATRRRNYVRLLEKLRGISNLSPIHVELPASAVPLSMPIRVTDGGRNALVASLQSEGIAATPWWSGYNRHLDFSGTNGVDLSAARDLKDTVLSVPVHQYLGPTEIDHIASRLRTLSRIIARA